MLCEEVCETELWLYATDTMSVAYLHVTFAVTHFLGQTKKFEEMRPI